MKRKEPPIKVKAVNNTAMNIKDIESLIKFVQSSGVAEVMFNGFLGEFIDQGLAPGIGLLWRLISYYPYILIGAIILPRWIREKMITSKKIKL